MINAAFEAVEEVMVFCITFHIIQEIAVYRGEPIECFVDTINPPHTQDFLTGHPSSPPAECGVRPGCQVDPKFDLRGCWCR